MDDGCTKGDEDMNVTFSRSFLAHAALLISLPALSFAATPDRAANLLACKQGSPCNRGRLTLSEMTEVAEAEHARNVWNCRTGLRSCDQSRLTEPESIALAVALRPQRLELQRGPHPL